MHLSVAREVEEKQRQMVAWVEKERYGLGLESGKEVPQREVSSLQTMLPA